MSEYGDNIPGQIQAAQNFVDACRYKTNPSDGILGGDTPQPGIDLTREEQLTLHDALSALRTYFTGENCFMDGYHPGPLTIINNGPDDDDDPGVPALHDQPVP